MATHNMKPQSVLTILAATDDHLQSLQHYGHSHDLREAMNTVAQMLDALQFLVRWHDQLTPADVQRAKSIITKATGGAE